MKYHQQPKTKHMQNAERLMLKAGAMHWIY